MASSSSTPPRKYQVFLSFRGEDTRNTFVGHLYTALVQRGIVTYKDDLNLKKGQSISPELMKAIGESQFAIIVFSKNYASSTWCMEELVKIMECQTEHGQTVIPIFYHVDPSDVRKQKNSFAESFAKHEENFKDNMEKVQIWKENLFKAGSLKGKHIRGEDEASCIKKIVEEIFSKLLREPSTKDLVGMESRMKELSSLLFKEPDAVRFVGIWGMGGIGKTTLARAIFYNFIHKFEAGCFLQDVSKKRDMVDLQKILLSKVLNLEDIKISDEHEGCRMIADGLGCKKVLLVLDDVNNFHQVKSLAGEGWWFDCGSRIIITTRDRHLLNKVPDIYEAHFLSNSDAMQLFCRHAFEQNHPDKDYGDLSDRVVSYARGLPLALKVLGSHLCGRGIDVWKSTLDRLKVDPEKDIVDVLKISFDGLSNNQQNIFLDIACFYRGWEEDDVKKRLHSRGFYPGADIPVLIQRSLIHILNGGIEMHDLIQEMGRHIVRAKANMDPQRYSRLWTLKDIYDALIDNTGIAEVEALVLDHDDDFGQGIDLSKGVFKKTNKLRLLDILGKSTFTGALDYLPNTLQWLSWRYYPGKYLPKDFRPINLVHLNLSQSSIVETPDVSGMPNLKVLDLSHCKDLLEVHPSIEVHKKLVRLNLSGCYKLEKFQEIIQIESLEILDLSGDSGYLPNTLQWLSWRGYPGKYLQDFRPINLVHLDLGGSSIVSVPESINRLSCLQVLELSHCEMLEALPDQLPSSIKKLDLTNCTSLTRVPSLVDLLGKCKDLNHFSLLGCPQLGQNPRSPTITCDLPAFWDWRSALNVLCTRQKMLQVYLPEIEIPDWFYRSIISHVTITLPPSWFNDKLRGFALFANSSYLDFKLHTCKGLVSFDDDDDGISEGGTAFWYIPISTITRDREWKDQNDSFLFEIKNYGEDASWGIRLVYEGEVDQDITHLTMTNPKWEGDWCERLKVCVAPRNHEEKPRDKQLLNKVGDIYKSDDEAMNLFCSHAFMQSHPAQDFSELSNRVVSNAHGIRLALEVLGSHLCGQRIDVWESALDRLKDAPEYTIFTSLEISFEGLSNIEQNIFLDIACFYRGWKEDDVKKRACSHDFHPVEGGITVLIQRSLIHILDGKIEMHGLIEEMGQYIVRQKGNFMPQRYSRLWFQYDICNVLLNNMGTAEIECLVYEEEGMSFNKGINLSRTFRKMNKLRLLDIETEESKFSEDCGYLPNTLQWLSWRRYPGKYLPKDFRPINLVHLDLSWSSIVETPDVSGMPNLEVLDLSRCFDLLEVHPSIGVHKKLVRLSLRWCNDLFKNRDGDEAVPCSDSQQLPLKRKRVEYDGPSKNVNVFSLLSLPSLRTLDISYCNVLGLSYNSFVSLPESIGCLASLQELDLSNNSFVSLPESIGYLTSLQELDLSYNSFVSLPESIGCLASLQKLDLSYNSFVSLPESIGCLASLQQLDLSYNSFVSLPESIGCLASLQQLDLRRNNLVSLPESIGCLASLQQLDLKWNNLVSLPESIGCLASLQKLDLRGNKFVSLPESINRLSCLQVLELSHCKMLEALPDQLPSSIKKLDLTNCTSLTRVPSLVDLLGKCEHLTLLSLVGCNRLVKNHMKTSPTIVSCTRDLLGKLKDWQHLSLKECLQLTPQSRAPDQILMAFRDWEVLQVYFPRIKIPDWLLYQNTRGQVKVTLSPSWYNDTLQGFALCANANYFNFELSTCNGPVSFGVDYDVEGTAFLYIPIGTITSGRDQWKDQKDSFLFEVTNARWNDKCVTSWGIRLVYEGEVDQDITHLTFTNDDDDNRRSRLKVCVTPRNES